MTDPRGKEFDGALPNLHFLRLRRLRFHLHLGGLIRAAGEIYAGTFLRHRHALFDAQIAHRRNCGAADFAHRARSGGGADVRAERRAGETLCRDDCDGNRSRHRATQELIRDYVLKNFTGKSNGQRPRVLFLVFRGPDAVEKIHRTVGHIVHERTSGETIRDTFGDYITDDSGKVTYFEPAVLTAIRARMQVERDLKLWAEFSDSDGGILDHVDRISRRRAKSKRRSS